MGVIFFCFLKSIRHPVITNQPIKLCATHLFLLLQWFDISWLASVSGGPLGWFWIPRWTSIYPAASCTHRGQTLPEPRSRGLIPQSCLQVCHLSLPQPSRHRLLLARREESNGYTTCIWEPGQGGLGREQPIGYACILVTGGLYGTCSRSLAIGITGASALRRALGPVDGMAEVLRKGWQGVIGALFNLVL